MKSFSQFINKKIFPNTKIVDILGNPLIVYHGTDDVFLQFENFPIWFSSDKNIAKGYGNNLILCYINLKNPYVFNYKPYRNEKNQIIYLSENDGTTTKKRSQEYQIDVTYTGVVMNDIIKRGFDGAISDMNFEEIVVFFPNQIKLIN